MRQLRPNRERKPRPDCQAWELDGEKIEPAIARLKCRENQIWGSAEVWFLDPKTHSLRALMESRCCCGRRYRKSRAKPKGLREDLGARERAEAAYYDRLACGLATDEQGLPY
jgi:hypothetical protein